MTATAAAGKSSATKELTGFVMVAVVVAAAVAGFASMVDAEFGVVGIVASAGDGWVVAAASTWVAGSAVAAAGVGVLVGVACASREVVE